MARIIAIHGIGQQRKGEHTLRSSWLPAVQDGLARAGHVSIPDRDFAVVFYGDPFRPPGRKSWGDPPLDATDLDPEWEGALLHLLVEAGETPRPMASIEAAKVIEATKAVLYAPMALQNLVARALRMPFFSALTERLLIWDLKQVRAYILDDEVRSTVQDRVSSVVNQSTRVIIGHSLGSIVAYEAICAHPEWRVRGLITLGSPLGIPSLIFDRLRPPPVSGRGHFPPGLKLWANIADRADPVALVKNLASCFGDRVKDFRVNNGATAHDIEPYLTARETGEALAESLREET